MPGGLGNWAGDYSMSIGRDARSEEDHVFAWNGTDSPIEVLADRKFVLLPDVEAGVGIGTDAPETTLHVKKSPTGAAAPADHVAILENTSDSSHADVLLLQIGAPTPAGTGSANNFITFVESNNESLGALQSNGASITLAGAGNDFAEWLPKTDPAEPIESGDIVGLRNGAVSLSTAGVERAMIVSTAPIVAGNDPGEHARDDHTLVAFIGQADVNVHGPVNSGDYIIASGDDGTGIAISEDRITHAQFRTAVGRALTASADPGVKTVRVMVRNNVPNPAVDTLEGDLTDLLAAASDLLDATDTLEARLAAVEASPSTRLLLVNSSTE